MNKVVNIITGAIWWVAVLFFISFISCLVVFKYTLPFANEYKPQIESNLTQIIGYPVKIDQITASLEGIDPTFTVRGIALDTEEVSSAIQMDALSIRIDLLKSFMNLTPHFVYIRFIKPRVDVVESLGQWRIAGSHSGGNDGSGVGSVRLMDYLVTQRQITLLDGEVHLKSDSYGNGVFSTDTFYMQRINNGIGIQTDLNHSQLESPFSLSLEIELHPGDDYQINAHLTSPEIRLDRESITELPEFGFDSFSGQFELWVRYQHNQMIQTTGLLNALNVVSTDNKTLSGSSKFSGFYNLRQESGRLEVSDLQLFDAQKNAYGSTNLSVDLSLKGKRNIDVLFDEVDLSLVSRWASTYINPKWFARKLLDEMDFKGKAKNGSLHISIDNPFNFEYVSNLKNASANGFNGIPKVSGLNGILSLSESDGYLEFDGKNTSIGFPTLYDDTWNVMALSGLVEWGKLNDVFLVSGKDLHIERNGANIDAGFRLEVKQDYPDWFLLDIKGKNIPIQDRLDYIPNVALDDETKEWIRSSLKAGQVDSLELVIQSELDKTSVPHVRLDMDLSDVDIQFAPDWPLANDVKGRFQLDQDGILVHVERARLSTLDVADIDVKLPFEKGANDLSISGPLSYELNDLLVLLRSTDLSQSVLSPFSDWAASGAVSGDFAVSLPLFRQEGEPVVGLNLEFLDNYLRINNLDLDAEQVSGAVHFHSNDGLTNSKLIFDAFGGQSTAILTSKIRDDVTEIKVALEGEVDLKQVLEWQNVPRLLVESSSGGIPYEADLSINSHTVGDVFLDVKSTLIGSAIDLPTPFQKTDEEIKDFSLSLFGAEQEFVVTMQYDELVRTRFKVKDSEINGGELLVGSNRPLVDKIEPGFNLIGQLPFVNFSDWLSAYGKYANDVDNVTSREVVEIPSWLNQIQFIADAVLINDSNDFHNVKLSYDRLIAPEVFQIDSDEANIKLSKTDNKYLLHAGYINWSSPESNDAEDAKKSPIKASQVPNIDVQVDELIYNGASYGDWAMSLINEGHRVRVQPITTKLSKGHFSGSLFWQDQDGRSNVELVISIEGGDAAELTRKFAPTPFLTSKEYSVDVNLSWLGHPLYFDKESVSGRIVFNAKKGKFTQIDRLPPFLKALGIFNINALARRLALDFTDVYEPGLTYDTFKGGLSLKDGIVNTASPIEISSPTAEFVLAGEANLITETLDERLTASFPLGNSLPIAGLLLGAPQVAGLLFITDKLIGDQLSKVTSVQYEVKGSFDDPEIKTIKYQPIQR
ncbi:YhdP family protein [Marinomonas sp. 2405UD68-3]|uniref:YhdP family phospholipid transporter n=1 Tax=Marinomonas sp. 2405UD68-3 TaxID=3391835 RepID=UPI0039C8C8B6